jgi:glutamate-1-semialdehyde 2,1-aminomutase
VTKLTLGFKYNNIASVQALFEAHPGAIAAVILEPAKQIEPEDGFLQEVRRICHENGALFVLDEMITGFRWHNGGAQKVYRVVPDLATFGKALANGFSVSALAGKREFMRLGGLDHERERVFLLSTTHGAETHALAAAIANMRVYENEPVIEHLYRQGTRLRTGLDQVIRSHGLGDFVSVDGRPCCLVYGTRDEQGRPSQAFRSLFLQETIRRGILAPSLVVGYCHTDADIDRTVEAINGALAIYRRALDEGPERYLVGRPSQTVFRRYN